MRSSASPTPKTARLRLRPGTTTAPGFGEWEMGRIIYDVSMSLDGFIAAAGMTEENGRGVGGDVLHDWYLGDSLEEHRLAERYDFGAFIVGRTTYDNSIRWWGAEGHAGGPTFVVS